MKFCSKCGKEINNEAVICPHCGCMVEDVQKKSEATDEVNAGLVILSVLLPIFGIIYWAVVHKETPKKGKACGVAALITVGVTMLIYIIIAIIVASTVAGMF